MEPGSRPSAIVLDNDPLLITEVHEVSKELGSHFGDVLQNRRLAIKTCKDPDLLW